MLLSSNFGTSALLSQVGGGGATHPIAREEKPHPNATSRTAEHHLPQVAVSAEEEADYRRTVATRRPSQPQAALELCLCRLQRVIYWAQDRDKVGKLACRTYRVRQRPLERTRAAGAPQLAFQACTMLPPVRVFLKHAHAIVGGGGGAHGPEALTRALVAMGEAQKRQCLRDPCETWVSMCSPGT